MKFPQGQICSTKYGGENENPKINPQNTRIKRRK
uniref:Uncharacterized protein n=1 Tax=Arundo donax TaxID=35708 RepID=A0A0A8YVP7_ARUDO